MKICIFTHRIAEEIHVIISGMINITDGYIKQDMASYFFLKDKKAISILRPTSVH